MEATNEIPIYVQLVSGTILGVALGNLLGGAAKFIQHPKTHRINLLHGLWMFFILGSIIVFWWQEGLSFQNVQWTFPLYLFQITYCATYLFMTAMLLPDDIDGYETHYDYFIDRRAWFFGSLILSFTLSIGDQLIKDGWDDILVDPTYIAFNFIVVGILAMGIVSRRFGVQLTVAIILVVLTILSMLVE
jgi:hypothetical protein